MNYYYTYRITCTHPKSTEKYYYGFRKSEKEPDKDWYWSSSKYIKHAIDEYGIEYFKKKIIKIFDNPEDAIRHESILHEKFKVDKNPIFFNRCRSTIWGFRSTGLILSGRTYEDIHGLEKAKQIKEQRSLSIREYRKNNPDSVKGKNNPNYGNKWSEEKRKEFASKRQGKNHPCYNLIWINDGVSTKKIDINDAIPEGWKAGRLKKNKARVDYHREKFMKSGLSRKEYAKKYNINYNTLKKWLKGVDLE